MFSKRLLIIFTVAVFCLSVVLNICQYNERNFYKKKAWIALNWSKALEFQLREVARSGKLNEIDLTKNLYFRKEHNMLIDDDLLFCFSLQYVLGKNHNVIDFYFFPKFDLPTDNNFEIFMKSNLVECS